MIEWSPPTASGITFAARRPVKERLDVGDGTAPARSGSASARRRCRRPRAHAIGAIFSACSYGPMRSTARTARGPRRAPARLVTPRSIGTPTSATSMSPNSPWGPCGPGREPASAQRETSRRRERPFAPVRIDEHLGGHRGERGIEDVAALGVCVLAAQGFELGWIHGRAGRGRTRGAREAQSVKRAPVAGVGK